LTKEDTIKKFFLNFDERVTYACKNHVKSRLNEKMMTFFKNKNDDLEDFFLFFYNSWMRKKENKRSIEWYPF